MAVVSLEELLESVKDLLGDNTSDKSIKIIEDITDTYNDAKGADNDDWKAKYEENDEAWRKKYRDRFFKKEVEKEEKKEEASGLDDVEVKTKYEELFEKKED